MPTSKGELTSSTDQLSAQAGRQAVVDALPGSGFLATAELPPRIYEALKTLCCLAAAKKPLQAHEVASATNLPPSQTAKILQQMTWAGFVESRRGTKGGFWLVKPAGRIRVADIVAVFYASCTLRRTKGSHRTSSSSYHSALPKRIQPNHGRGPCAPVFVQGFTKCADREKT